MSPGETFEVAKFQFMMLSALLAAAVWINLATVLNAPVSTTHSIVGGVLGGGVAAAGFSIVNWATMSKIAKLAYFACIWRGCSCIIIIFYQEKDFKCRG